MVQDLTKSGLQFNGSVHIQDRSERLTAKAGAVLLREFMERLKLPQWLSERLVDPRNPELITHPQIELLMTSVILKAVGCPDQDDADRLRDDEVMRLATSTRRGLSPLETHIPEPGHPKPHNPAHPDGLGSQPTQSRLLRVLGADENLEALRQGLRYVAVERRKTQRKGHRRRHLTLDLDSLPIEVHGHQQGGEYNGHYHVTMYHPLVCSIAETGDLLDLKLRHGRAHTAEGDLAFVLPLMDEVERTMCQVASLRIDAGFPDEEFLGGLESRNKPYVARVKNNAVLDRKAKPYLQRPWELSRPRKLRTWFHELTYQAESWSRARRVVLVVLEKKDQAALDYFWLITNWTNEQMDGPALLALYRQRGTAEGHQGELMDVLSPKLSSTTRPKSHYRGQPPKRVYPAGNPFAQNEALLLLNALAYNVAHGLRVLMAADLHRGVSLKTFQEQVLRVAARVVLHGGRATVVLAQQAVAWWKAALRKLQSLHLWVAQGTA